MPTYGRLYAQLSQPPKIENELCVPSDRHYAYSLYLKINLKSKLHLSRHLVAVKKSVHVKS